MVNLPRILVVGGGIAGTCTAIALREHGFAPELVEARSTQPVEGAAITLHANGVRALRTLGLGAALGAVADVVPRWAFHDVHGRLLCETDLAALWEGVGPCLGVTRAELMRVLYAAAGDLPVRFGCAVTALRGDEARVHVGFADGSSADYDLVIGADGTRSAVRRLAVASVAPHRIGTTGWRSVVDGRPPGVAHLVLLLGEGCFFGLVPVGAGRTYGFAGTATGSGEGPAREHPGRFRDRFAAFGSPVSDYLALLDATPLHAAPVEDLELDRWHRGNVLLIGDAAHAMPPHAGQGGSLAAEDALVLAEELARADTLPAAFARFTARRRPRVEWVRRQTRAAAAAWMLPPPQRDQVLRERGDRLLQERYRPLRALP
jgi:FAD-dependent urate hydroxylase